MQTTVTSTSAAGTQGKTAHAEPLKFSKRIGSTTYVVAVHFSQTAKESVQDKVLGLIESEVRNSA